MPENLRETIEKDQAILTDPNATLKEKRDAYFDRIISRRLLSQGVEELPDQEDETTSYEAAGA